MRPDKLPDDQKQYAADQNGRNAGCSEQEACLCTPVRQYRVGVGPGDDGKRRIRKAFDCKDAVDTVGCSDLTSRSRSGGTERVDKGLNFLAEQTVQIWISREQRAVITEQCDRATLAECNRSEIFLEIGGL